MNRNVKRAIIGGVAGVSVALGGAWYIAAGQIVDGTKVLIDGINSKPRTDGYSIKITYDGLARTMFPAVGVRLVNPAIEVNSPGLPVAKVGTPGAAPEPFHVTWKHTGTIDVITDYLMREYRLVNDGSGVGSLETGSDKAGAAYAEAHSELMVKAKDHAAFKQWQSLDFANPAAMKQALTQVGAAHIAAGALKLTDTLSGATLLTQEQAKFDLTNQSDDKKIKLDLAVLSKGSEVTKEYSDLIKRMMTMLHMPAEIIDGAVPMTATRAGKQDVDIVLNADFTMPAPNQPPSGDIHVTRLNIANNFYHLSAPIDVVLHEDAVSRHAAIKLNWSLAISPAGAKEMEGMLDNMLPMLSNLYGAATPAIDPAVLKQKIVAALPVVSTLGPMTLVLDVDANIAKTASESSPEKKSESLDLRQFTFAHKRWAIDAKGKSGAGEVNGTLTCKQCTTLTQDMFETARAAQEVMLLLQPANVQFPLTEATLTQVNSTLAEIGKPGAAMGDLDFVVTTLSPTDVRLNDKPMAEVLPKLVFLFSPQPPAAPASVDPAPASPQPAPGTI